MVCFLRLLSRTTMIDFVHEPPGLSRLLLDRFNDAIVAAW